MEQIEIFIESMNKIKGDLYLPIFLNGKLYAQFHKRPFLNVLYNKLSLFPRDFNQETIFDLGCNTGFILLWLRKFHNSGKSLGIDNDFYAIEIANYIAKFEDLKEICFERMSLSDKEQTKKMLKADNVFFLSINDKFCSGPDSYFKLNFEECVELALSKANKAVYIEPTNHSNLSREETRDIYLKDLSKYGNVELLGYTDYQNRGLFRINLK